MTDNQQSDSSLTRYVYLVPQSRGPVSPKPDEPDVAAIWRAISAGRWLVAAIASGFFLAGCIYAFVASEWYEADVVLSPVGKKFSSGGLAQFSGLASLAGIDLPGADNGEPIAVLKSRSFIREFIESQQLLPVLFSDKWNQATQTWSVSGKSQPDIRDGVKYFDEEIRRVNEDKRSGLVTLTIRWKNADASAQWANLLVKRLNERLRAQAIHEAQSSIEYLQREMLATSVISLQQSVGRVLEGEMQKMTLARANEEFAFRIVDSATPPKRHESPKRVAILVISALLGLFVGSLWVAVRSLYGKTTISTAEA